MITNTRKSYFHPTTQISKMIISISSTLLHIFTRRNKVSIRQVSVIEHQWYQISFKSQTFYHRYSHLKSTQTHKSANSKSSITPPFSHKNTNHPNKSNSNHFFPTSIPPLPATHSIEQPVHSKPSSFHNNPSLTKPPKSSPLEKKNQKSHPQIPKRPINGNKNISRSRRPPLSPFMHRLFPHIVGPTEFFEFQSSRVGPICSGTLVCVCAVRRRERGRRGYRKKKPLRDGGRGGVVLAGGKGDHSSAREISGERGTRAAGVSSYLPG